MNRLNATFQLFFVLIWTIASGQYTSIINSNRPGLTQGAYSVGPGVYQLEFGISYRQDKFLSLAQAKSKGAGFTLDLRTGLILQNLELIYRVDYHNDQLTFNNVSGPLRYNRKGTKRNTVGFKLLLFDPFRNTDWYKVNTKSYKANKGIRFIDLLPALSVYFGSELSFGNIYPYGEPFSPIFNLKTPELKQNEISGELMLITQNHFLNNFVLVTNGDSPSMRTHPASQFVKAEKREKGQSSPFLFLVVVFSFLQRDFLRLRATLVHATARGTSTVIMANVLAMFGNMFAFKGSYQAEVRTRSRGRNPPPSRFSGMSSAPSARTHETMRVG